MSTNFDKLSFYAAWDSYYYILDILEKILDLIHKEGGRA